jgi:hypothetical protein
LNLSESGSSDEEMEIEKPVAEEIKPDFTPGGEGDVLDVSYISEFSSKLICCA